MQLKLVGYIHNILLLHSMLEVFLSLIFRSYYSIAKQLNRASVVWLHYRTGVIIMPTNRYYIIVEKPHRCSGLYIMFRHVSKGSCVNEVGRTSHTFLPIELVTFRIQRLPYWFSLYSGLDRIEDNFFVDPLKI